ncbi:GNAT family N-acetyltransferase [Yinghuangia aomiensis]
MVGGHEQPDITAMLRANQSIRLRPANDGDTPFLWALFAADEISYGWIFRGRMPTPEMIAANLQRPDILPNIIESVKDRRPLGYVAAFDVSDRNGHAQLGVVSVPEHLETGLGITAAMSGTSDRGANPASTPPSSNG